MKQFILEVPEGITGCSNECTFFNNQNVCDYLCENGLCNQYDFKHLNIKECDERY